MHPGHLAGAPQRASRPRVNPVGTEYPSPYATWEYSRIRRPRRSRHRTGHSRPDGLMRTPGRRVLVQRPMWPVHIVMIDVLVKDHPQVPLASDQQPVQALAPGAGNPALRDRVRPRRPHRRPDDPRADRGKNRVESRGELGVPVPDQEPEAVSVIPEAHLQVPRLLRHPLPRRVSRNPGWVHTAGAMLNEEQHRAAQEHGVDMEQVGREDRLGLQHTRPHQVRGPVGNARNASPSEAPSRPAPRISASSPGSSSQARRYPARNRTLASSASGGSHHASNSRPRDSTVSRAQHRENDTLGRVRRCRGFTSTTSGTLPLRKIRKSGTCLRFLPST
jgi:hypothetical protein